MRTIKSTGQGSAPSFDHAQGDPIEDDIKIEQAHKVVLVEGNYLLLPEKPWDELRDLFDQRWLLQVHLLLSLPPSLSLSLCIWCVRCP